MTKQIVGQVAGHVGQKRPAVLQSGTQIAAVRLNHRRKRPIRTPLWFGRMQMTYRVHWRLLGRDNRLLDSGEIDNGFEDRRAALQVLGAFLHQFVVWDRNEEDGTWRARRAADADLVVQISLAKHTAVESDMMPAMWTTRQSAGPSLRP